MKKMLLTLAFMVFASPAFAATITFDPTFPSIPPDVTVQYFDDGMTGPLSSLPTPNTVPLSQAGSAIPGGGNALELYWEDYQFGPYGALFTFASLQSTISAVGNDFGGDAVDDNEIVYLTAFDSSGILIGSSSHQDPYAAPNLQPITFTSAQTNIKYIAFTWMNDLGYYTVDNIEYSSAVPEPMTMLLLGLGFIGMGVVRRKIKK